MSVRKVAIRLTREADDDLKSISMYTWQTWGEKQVTNYEAEIEVLRILHHRQDATGQIEAPRS